jgi:hypothetical protein
MKENGMDDWFLNLSEEDKAFIKRFVVASGSLKDMATHYNVSYPTLRIRLNRLIDKITILDDPKLRDPFRKKIQVLAAEGHISTPVAREILKEYDQSAIRRKAHE